MAEAMQALLRALASLRDAKVWGYLLAPAVLSFALWIVLAFWGLGWLVEQLIAAPPMNWLAAWGVVWLAHLLAYLGGWLAIFAAAYLTASLLAAIFVMPWLLRRVAATDYPDVAAMGADSVLAATANSLWAAVLFVAGWLLCLPLWLVPGLAVVLPLLLMAWYNRKTFAYDALAAHATPGEWREVRAARGGGLFLLGLAMALLAHVPFVGLLVPGLAALAYIHFGLEALRQARRGAIVTLEGEAL